MNSMRYDLQIIASWIAPGSRVLSLGCGEGELLFYLKHHRQVAAVGIETVEDRVATCLAKGLSVIQGDINQEILHYPDQYFDYVILSQTLQQVYHPARLIPDMLRIGKKGIVSFPNFSHWRIRRQVLFSGRAPLTPQLPYAWYDTPNIRIITLTDFRRFARKLGVDILRETTINTDKQNRRGRIISVLPNLRATYGIFLIGRPQAG